MDAITKQGYPLPTAITPEMVTLSGAAHACGVAIDLAETRGIEGKNSTYESYTVKNRFDRFVAKHVPQPLREDWVKPLAREVGYINPAITYPNGVDVGLIHGIAKPHRYYPAQTMRYLEFARLGKLDDQTTQQLNLTDATDLSAFGVSWEALVPIIESAEDVVELSSGLATEIATRLLENGLNPNQVAGILKKGYSLQSMQKEHGHVEQSDEVYRSLLTKLQFTTDTASYLSFGWRLCAWFQSKSPALVCNDRISLWVK